MFSCFGLLKVLISGIINLLLYHSIIQLAFKAIIELFRKWDKIMATEKTKSSSIKTSNNISPTSESLLDYDQFGHGHFFTKKTFHKPTYCHHCTDLLWGLIGQGCICEVCNFVAHERCLKTVVTPCSTVAASVIKNPVPHCWTDVVHFKRKFCSVCRKRIEEQTGISCQTCETYCHTECQDFSVPNCKECATYVPDQKLPYVFQYHHWREGNLPPNSKCFHCRKNCWSVDCLSGMRCEWCTQTAHAGCYKELNPNCTYGFVHPIILPPFCVNIPRTDVPLETIVVGGTNKRKTDVIAPRSSSDELSVLDLKSKLEVEEFPKDKEEELVKVYDGNASVRRRNFRTIIISRTASKDQVTAAALRAFHIYGDPKLYFITDFYDPAEKELTDAMPIQCLTKKDDKKLGIIFRFRTPVSGIGSIRVYPGKLNVDDTYRTLPVTDDTSVEEVMLTSLNEFGLDPKFINRYRLVEVSLDKGAVHERTMDNQESPWELIKNVARESVRQKENIRFYLQTKDEVYCSNVAIFVGNLPPNLSQRQYEKILVQCLGKPYKYRQIGPIYYEYGSLIITYDNADIAVKAFYMLRDYTYDEKNLLVLLLPNVMANMIPEGFKPLLVFVNVKSGGCQGQELISAFRKILNPYQVFDLENGGPLPGLYVFRFVRNYRILVCGGDGTVGWVLQCLDNVGQDSECQSPPCAILPLGTGNDLARVLRWGTGYTGGEDPMNLLRDVMEAEEIRLDRWTVVFHTDETVKYEEKSGLPANSSGSTSEDNTAIYVMNNYFGIGIDADLCLGFHTAREENPDKFNSRLHNKSVYFKMGLRKMVAKKNWKELQKVIKVQVDGKTITLPQVEGIIILNILSWGSGANPWGLEKDSQFANPNHYDGMLEVVGVTGVVHMGQIQSGLRNGIRIAQGGHIRIRINTEMPVQVDGEPWIQSPGEVVVLKSALKATMLRRIKIKRRNTEPLITTIEKALVNRALFFAPDKSLLTENQDQDQE